jgi:hypothetical protein
LLGGFIAVFCRVLFFGSVADRIVLVGVASQICVGACESSLRIVLVALVLAIQINAGNLALFVVLVVQRQYLAVLNTRDPSGIIVLCGGSGAVAVGETGLSIALIMVDLTNQRLLLQAKQARLGDGSELAFLFSVRVIVVVQLFAIGQRLCGELLGGWIVCVAGGEGMAVDISSLGGELAFGVVLKSLGAGVVFDCG